MKQKIEQLVAEALDSQGISRNDGERISIEHPGEIKNGDYATNAALIYGKKLAKNPIELAVALVEYLSTHKPAEISKVEVAGPGFINFYLTPEYFSGRISH